MEPAIVLSTAVAGLGIGGWLAAQIPQVARALPGRLEAMAVTVVPHRVIATLVLAVAGLSVVPRPQGASAEPLPPLVRLTDQPIPEAAVAPYEVQRGDSLWRIAAATLEEADDRSPTSATVARFWPRIYEANRSLIGDDPNLILPGQHLTIPEP
ncbi:MAG: hypothetical protein BMS9Abin07_0374 [Acidimicrobiia bacterium]|nr:MAG: hypothetical protein BMS9Abin07_0374 [Acidimicrobiia bacterium]